MMFKFFKWLNLFVLVILFAILLSCPVGAEETSEVEQTVEDYGQAEIIDALPDGAKDILEDNDITPDNSGALNLSSQNVFEAIWNLFMQNVTKPLRLLLSITGIALLASLSKAMNVNANSNMTKVFSVVTVIAGGGMLVTSISESVSEITGVLTEAAEFMLVFIPVFAGILAVNGQLATASIFNGIIISASQLIAQLGIHLLLPLSSSILGISLAGAINPDIKIENVAKVIKTIVIWVLGLGMTIFIGLLSIQSIITTSSDTLMMKTAKFAVSSAVPIVGGSISEGLSSVYSSLGIIKSSVGSFGIIAGITVMAPSIASVLMYKLALVLAGAVCDLFGVDELSSLVKCGNFILTMLIAVASCFLLISIISIGMMLMMQVS